MPERVFIIWDFTTKGGLRDNLSFAKRSSTESLVIDFPDPEESMQQGQIWLTLVKPQLDRATRVIGFMDLPNANVGFELGYAVGQQKKVALAVHLDRTPSWLEKPPFAGFSRPPMPELSDIEAQAASDDWFYSDAPVERGHRAPFLCPRRAGQGYARLVAKHHQWATLPEVGWTLDSMAEHVSDTGAIVWAILPHTEGSDARDGVENAGLAVVAGYAASKGVPVFVLRHTEARTVADIMSEARPFSGVMQFEEILPQVAADIERAIAEAERPTRRDRDGETLPRRPSVPPPFAFDFEETVGRRFVGRRRFRPTSPMPCVGSQDV